MDQPPVRRVLSCLVSYRDCEKIAKAIDYQLAIVMPAQTQVDVYVFDNSENGKIQQKIQQICKEKAVKLEILPQNLGVSGAYAAATKIALEQNYDYLWLWDQDSHPPEDCLVHLMRTFDREPEKQKKYRQISSKGHTLLPLGVVLPKLFDPTLEDRHWIFFAPPFDMTIMTKERFPMDMVEGGEVATTYMVNSGALINRQTLQQMGPPNPDFFMDLVDFEFASRLTHAGIRMVMNADAVVIHSVGQPIQYRLLGRSLWARNYPIFRYYYQSKNEMLLAKASSRPLWISFKSTLRLSLRPIKILFDRDLQLKKIGAHFIGWFDGLRGIKGKSHAAWMAAKK
jgi:rhamnosyltransferase